MFSSNFVQGLNGWAVGYNYSSFKIKEDEYRQGTSHLIPICQMLQFNELSNIVIVINQLVPPYLFKSFVNLSCQLSCFSFIPFIFSSLIDKGLHIPWVKSYNENFFLTSSSSSPLPKISEKLNSKITQLASFVFVNSGEMMRVAVVITSLATILLGNVYFGAANLTAISYQILDQLGYIPRKISLFMETCLSFVTPLGSVLQGSWLTRAFSAISLLDSFSSSFSCFTQCKVDLLFKKLTRNKLLALSEFEKPLIPKNNLTYQEIKKILYDDSQVYKINPPHYRHLVNEPSLLRNNNLDLYFELFNKVDWSAKSLIIEKKLKDDERFIDFIETSFPLLKSANYRNENNKLDEKTLNHYIQILAERSDLSFEEYLVNYFKEQFGILLSILKGEYRVKGMQRDLQKAIINYEKILHYLQSNEKQEQIELEDFLLKMAVEAGNYCALRINKTAQELIEQITYELASVPNYSSTSYFELKIQQTLQSKRKAILENQYHKLPFPNKVKEELHFYNEHKNWLSLGFYPLTKTQRHSVNMVDIIQRLYYKSYQDKMYKQYKKFLFNDFKDSVLYSQRKGDFGTYIYETIKQNNSLNEEQKIELIDLYADYDLSEDEKTKQQEKFFLLMLVQLGIIIPY